MKPVYETEMLIDVRNGIYLRTTYYSDGSIQETRVPKGMIIIPPTTNVGAMSDSESIQRLIELNQSHSGNKKSKWLFLLMFYNKLFPKQCMCTFRETCRICKCL